MASGPVVVSLKRSSNRRMNVSMSITALENLRAEMQSLHARIVGAGLDHPDLEELLVAVESLADKWNQQLATLTLLMLPPDAPH